MKPFGQDDRDGMYLGDTKSIDIHIILKYWELAKKFCLYVDGVLRVLYMSLLWKY